MSEDASRQDDVNTWVFEAQELIDRRRYGQARAVLTKALRQAPENLECLYLSAFIDYAEDHQQEAFAGVDAVLRLSPQHYGARRLRASLLDESGQLAEAEAEWISLLREYPEDADSFGSYAMLMLRTLESDKAKRLAQEGLRHEPSHEACLYVLALLDVIRNPAGQGDGALRRLLKEHPERLRTSLALVSTLSNRGDRRAALSVAQELLRSQPDSADLVQLVRDLRYQTHWSMKPLYPVQRWGWGGAIVLYVGAVLVLSMARKMPGPLSMVLAFAWLGYCVYSWFWPGILRKLLG
jgi:predicted Zn-dependent protease